MGRIGPCLFALEKSSVYLHFMGGGKRLSGNSRRCFRKESEFDIVCAGCSRNEGKVRGRGSIVYVVRFHQSPRMQGGKPSTLTPCVAVASDTGGIRRVNKKKKRNFLPKCKREKLMD